MVHDLFPFLIVAAVVCGGVLVFLYIDYRRGERRAAFVKRSLEQKKGGAV